MGVWAWRFVRAWLFASARENNWRMWMEEEWRVSGHKRRDFVNFVCFCGTIKFANWDFWGLRLVGAELSNHPARCRRCYLKTCQRQWPRCVEFRHLQTVFCIAMFPLVWPNADATKKGFDQAFFLLDCVQKTQRDRWGGIAASRRNSVNFDVTSQICTKPLHIPKIPWPGK